MLDSKSDSALTKTDDLENSESDAPSEKFVIFISHAHEDSDVATQLKILLEEAFNQHVSAFASSESIYVGDDWRRRLFDSIHSARLFLILLTPHSFNRTWIAFEAGAAYGRQVGFVPVCAKGLGPDQLTSPLGDSQALKLDSHSNILMLLDNISTISGLRYSESKCKSHIEQIIQSARLDDNLPFPLAPEDKVYEKRLFQQMRTIDNQLTQPRRYFWEALRAAYQPIYLGKKHYPNEVEALIDECNPPRGLPLSQTSHLRNYVVMHRRFLAGPDSLLYAFCETIYPQRQAQQLLSQISVVPATLFDKFHVARAKLSDFYDTWAQLAFEQRTIDVRRIISTLASQRRLVMVLCYLDICLQHWTQDEGPGRCWLHRLAHDWDLIASKGSPTE